MIKSLRGIPLAHKRAFVASVLIPTRGRPDKLKRAIHSLYEKAKDPKGIEVILRVDDDDKATLDMLEKEAPFQASVITGPRGRGYLDIHHFIHAMAKVSKGEWLVAFNDDAIMKTQDWEHLIDGLMFDGDEIYENGDRGVFWADGIWLLVPCLTKDIISNEFFIVNKRVYEVLGHLSLNMGVDVWLDNVLTIIGRRMRVEIDIEHPNDENDRTFKEGRGTVKGNTLRELTNTYSVKRERLRDAVTLLDYIEDCRKKGLGKMEIEVCEEGYLIEGGGLRGIIPKEKKYDASMFYEHPAERV